MRLAPHRADSARIPASAPAIEVRFQPVPPRLRRGPGFGPFLNLLLPSLIGLLAITITTIALHRGGAF